MVHLKSESDDVTSLAPSSPHSPKRLAYYVQSPSHDGSKSSSVHATPVFNSPLESPSHSSYARNSRESSASRVSGTVKWASVRKRADKAHCGVIDEEGDYYHDRSFGGRDGFSRQCWVVIVLFSISLVFASFCFIIWGASRPFKAKIQVQSLTVHSFYVGDGADLTGVPTRLATMNCSMKMIVHNPATFFGIHVSSMPINLMYSEITVATGEMERYYLPRQSYRTISVNLEGDKVPLYGAGASIPSLDNGELVPMKLVFTLLSKGSVVGKLVRSTHSLPISCSLIINGQNTKPIKLKENSCSS